MTTTTTTTISASSPIIRGHFNLSHDNSNNSSNMSSINSTAAYLGRNEGLAVFEVAISATILFLAVTGNSVVVALLMLKRGKLSRMHLMMLHLSLADLSVAFFQVLPQMVWDITFRFQGGAFLCGAVKYLQLVTMYGSSYVLLSMAVDRYLAICRPFLTHSWGSRQAHLLVLAAWTFALLFSLPQVFIFSLMEAEEGVYDCWATFDPPWTLTLYVTWNVLSVFVAPSLILAALYGLISYTVWRTSTLEESLAPRYIPPHPAPTDNPHPPHPPSCLSKHPRDTPPQDSATSPNDEASPDCTHTDHSKLIADPPANRTTAQALKGASAGRISGSSRGPAGPGLGEVSREARGSSHKGEGVQQNGNPTRQGDLMEMVLHRPASSDPHDTTLNSSMPPCTERSALSPNPAPPHHAANSAPPHPALGSAAPPGTKTPPRAGGGKGGRGTRGRGRGEGGISRAKMKTIKLTLTVVLVYMICWTPFYVAQLWAAYDEDVSYDNIFFTLVLLLASVNSCTNPWIYLAFSDTLWTSLRSTLRSLACCLRFHPNQHPSPRAGATCSTATTTHPLCSLGSFRTSAAVNGDSML